MSRLRTRTLYIALALGTIALGLAVHWGGGAITPRVRDVLGDALWAAMMVWWVGVAAPALHPSRRAVVALAICCAVEFSQLAHTPTLDALRGMTLGQLVLGSGFDPRDLVAYAIGVLAAGLVDRVLMSLIIKARKGVVVR